ncbi:uncharacterized protein [Lolium perenne]|uniref:uncharacterized protein n=1 Tax=Lolium perenne TaxID=4522 RepID=UPI0021F576DA|nr:uncharacterized protein LOC127331637 [Lolium perenne]
MATLRHAARRMLASQAPQPIYRAAVAEQQRRLLPTVTPGSSSAYPRRFSSMQHGEADLLTVEEKIRIFKRGTHLLYRATKAVAKIVGCCYALKLSFIVIITPIPELISNLEESKKKAQDMLQELRGKAREA